MNSLNTPQDANKKGIRNAISTGADLGTKTGCLLSMLYSVLGSPAILAILGDLDFAPRFFGVALALYMLVLIPVLLLGAITGAILGWLSKILSSVVPPHKCFVVGILVCVILLVVIHVAFFAFSPQVVEEVSGYKNESNRDSMSSADELFSPLGIYLIVIGIPSILYIASGGWLSYKLSLKPSAAQ